MTSRSSSDALRSTNDKKSDAMSSSRARRDGSSSCTTFNRAWRSSRNRPSATIVGRSQWVAAITRTSTCSVLARPMGSTSRVSSARSRRPCTSSVNEVFGNDAAVHSDERTTRARGGPMQETRYDLLARTGLAGDKDGDRRRGDVLDAAQQLYDGVELPRRLAAGEGPDGRALPSTAVGLVATRGTRMFSTAPRITSTSASG